MLDLERNTFFKAIEEYFYSELSEEIDLSSQVNNITINDYSYCFEFVSCDQYYYAKIAKCDQLLLRKNEPIIPFSQKDLAFGKAEYESLITLDEEVSFSGVKLIEVVTYLEKTNTLITKKVEGSDLFILLRKASFMSSHKTRYKSLSLMNDLTMFYKEVSLGSDLQSRTFYLEKLKIKIKSYMSVMELGTHGEEDFLSSLSHGEIENCLYIVGYKGFDIRNVIYCKDGTLAVLDPGKKKLEPIEAYFSRIYVTLVLIFWGHPFFFFNKTLHDDFLVSFEDHMINEAMNPLILLLQIRKEFYKHWGMAVFALNNKKWPSWIKNIFRKYYIDTFYNKFLRENKTKILILKKQV